MEKKISCRLFFTVMWRGFCQALRYVGKLFGCTDKTNLGKVIWHIASACFTILLAIFTCMMLYFFAVEVIYDKLIRPATSDEIYEKEHISNHIVVQKMYYSGESRLYDNVQKKVLLKDIDWVVVSDDKDSLAVFSKDGCRGYLNRFTGEVVIPLTYSRAWIFSEGLAAVEKDGELLFIDHDGNVVIDRDFQAYYNHPGYAFKNGYCMLRDNVTEKMGLIDRNGDWALAPEYDNLFNDEGFWQVEKDGRTGLYTANLECMFPVENSSIRISDGVIEVSHADHTGRLYDYEGNVLVDFVIDEVSNLVYETDRVREDVSADSESGQDYRIYGVANRQVYRVSSDYYCDYYGLIGRDGRRITPPLYTRIDAIGKDRYLCQPQGVIIDDNGRVVE